MFSQKVKVIFYYSSNENHVQQFVKMCSSIDLPFPLLHYRNAVSKVNFLSQQTVLAIKCVHFLSSVYLLTHA